MKKCNEDFCINPAGMGIEPSKTVVLPIDMKDMDIFQDAFFVSLHLKFGPTLYQSSTVFLNQDIQHVCRNPMEVLWLSHVVPGFASKSSEAVGNSVPALQNGSFFKGKAMVKW